MNFYCDPERISSGGRREEPGYHREIHVGHKTPGIWLLFHSHTVECHFEFLDIFFSIKCLALFMSQGHHAYTKETVFQKGHTS